MKYIKLSQWAANNNYTYNGAYQLFKRGGISNTKVLPSGTILVQEENNINDDTIYNHDNDVIIYCRVSSNKQKDDLKRQVERMSNYAISNGYNIKHVYKEIASGMNDNRKQLNKMMEDVENCKIIIEHKDRLSRFGFNYLKQLFLLKNTSIVVVNEATTNEHDLANDLISVVTSFCAKLYGQRKGKRKTDSIINTLKD